MTPSKNCKLCGVVFEKKPDETNKRFAERLYCGYICSNRAKHEAKGPPPEQHPCLTCGDPIKQRPTESREAYKNRKYCCNKCRPSNKIKKTVRKDELVGQIMVLLGGERFQW